MYHWEATAALRHSARPPSLPPGSRCCSPAHRRPAGRQAGGHGVPSRWLGPCRRDPLPALHKALGDALQGVALDLGVAVLDQRHGLVLGAENLHDAASINHTSTTAQPPDQPPWSKGRQSVVSILLTCARWGRSERTLRRRRGRCSPPPRPPRPAARSETCHTKPISSANHQPRALAPYSLEDLEVVGLERADVLPPELVRVHDAPPQLARVHLRHVPLERAV